MAKKLSPHDSEFLGSIIDSIAETIKECSNDYSNPFIQEFGKKLSYIQDAFIMQKFDAETYLNKLDEVSNSIENHSDFHAQFRGIMFSHYDQAKKQLHLGYAFDGEPSYPEHFNVYEEEGDRFAGKEGYKEYTFKYQCPKIGGQKFAFSYCTNKREDNGDYWIELSNVSKLGLLNTLANGGEAYNRFELRQIQDGELYSMRSNGVLLEALLSMAAEDEEYELAFVDGYMNDEGEFKEIDTKPLSKEEISTFKSYIRAFVEAIEGEGRFSDDLAKFAEQQQQGASSEKKGCLGVLLIPIIAIGGLLMTIL